MSAGHYENFPVASLLVPSRLRRATLAIYRFARAADDLADEGTATPAARLAALAEFDAGLAVIEQGGTPAAPPFPELARAIAEHALPVALFRDLLSAFAQDVTTTRYATAADLHDYCRRSANPIGRLLLHLYGAAAPAPLAWSDAICTALQLANFWQDVASDWERGRIYLPQEDMTRFGVRERTIAQAAPDAAWRALMRFETARTRSMLESGRPLVRVLPWRLRLELAGVLAGAHRVLDAIDAVEGDVFAHRPRLTATDWFGVAFRALFPARRHVRARLGGAA
ncbi:MAG TPA: squalene synthase HpnC [Casimicrobiaceae bacterium]|nr:squalene synthase HpnC [Casimicrobiaceae bacterium]